MIKLQIKQLGDVENARKLFMKQKFNQKERKL